MEMRYPHLKEVNISEFMIPSYCSCWNPSTSFFLQKYSWDRIMKSPQKSRGDPGESNIRQLLHPVGPSLGSWLFG